MPKVSVVITAYNSMAYLPETLESVLQQTFTDFEVLIIDDGSSDNIAEWATRITDRRVKFISQTNQGVAVARNKGITNAQGEYIAFLDGDDFWAATKLEQQVRCLDNHPAVGLVHTWTAIVDQKGLPTGRVIAFNAEGYVWQKLLEQNQVACSSVLVRRCCFETVGMFAPDRKIYPVEDWDMWLRIAACYPFAVIKKTLYYYRQHPKNGSKKWQIMERACNLVIEKTFESVPPDLLYLKNHSYGYANLCLAWKVLLSSDQDYKQVIRFRASAISHYPQLRFRSEYIRLSLAITLLRWLKPSDYNKFIEIVYAVRRRLSNM